MSRGRCRNAHWWRIHPPELAVDGRCAGKCRWCGAERMFENVQPSGSHAETYRNYPAVPAVPGDVKEVAV